LQRIEAKGGVEARWKRHREMLQAMEKWVDDRGSALGLSYLPVKGRRSWTVSCIRVPHRKNGREIQHTLSDRGWTIASGYGEFKKSTIRVGHMGDHTVDELLDLLVQLEEVVA